MQKFCAIILLGCDLCDEEKTGKNHSGNESGIEITVCNDCYKGMKELLGY